MRRTQSGICLSLSILIVATIVLLPSNSLQELKAQTGSAGTIQPVGLPDPKIPGFRFPEAENTILQWVKANKQKEINIHGWGIWTALNMPSGEQDLRVFETWLTPDNIMAARLTRVENLAKLERTLPIPTVPHQFHHGKARRLAALPNLPSVNQPLVTVQYDPNAANHIKDNKLFQVATLNALLTEGKTDVPAFLPPSVALKPTYITAMSSNLVDGRYFRLEAWPGPPPQPQQYGPGAWKQWVWVDVQDPGVGKGTGKVDTVGTPQSRTPETTYGLGCFIFRKLNTVEAQAENAVRTAIVGKNAGVAVSGDYRILVGMHVTSREITRWTWQTFWWTPQPDTPPAPSSSEIVGDRPAALKDAPRHYAMSIGYDMLTPATPNSGGGDNGTPIYVFNPWLEAGFGPDDLPDSKSWTFQGKTYENKYGMQTNCMSCHEQANFGSKANAPDYTADRYIDLNGRSFNGVLKVDFLWSIPGNAK